MRTHFEKYAFLHQILVFFLNYIVTVYAKTYYSCWFESAESLKHQMHDAIGIHDDVTI